MAKQLLLTGIHAIEGSDKNFHAVGVFVDISKRYTQKYGLLLNDKPYFSLKSALEDIKQTHIDEIVKSADPHKDMDLMYTVSPKRDGIGETINATLVGWHLDYKKNPDRKRSPGMVIVNAGFMFNGEVHFSCIDKLEVDKHATQQDIRDIIETYVETAKGSFEFGSPVEVEVVPSGASAARYVMKELIDTYNRNKNE